MISGLSDIFLSNRLKPLGTRKAFNFGIKQNVQNRVCRPKNVTFQSVVSMEGKSLNYIVM